MVRSRWRCWVITACVALVLLASGVQGVITPEEKAAALKEKEVTY